MKSTPGLRRGQSVLGSEFDDRRRDVVVGESVDAARRSLLQFLDPFPRGQLVNKVAGNPARLVNRDLQGEGPVRSFRRDRNTIQCRTFSSVKQSPML